MKILVIAAHMDDEVLGVGGTIAKHVQQGDAVTVCIVANRAYGHRYDDAAILREQEAARQAQRVLGYQDLRLLNLPDEQLDRALIHVIVPLERVYDELRPELVYAPHRGDPHQDHRAVFDASIIVCRPLDPRRPSRFLCYEVPSSTDQGAPFADYQFLPNSYEILPAACVQKKVEAMRCYERESRAFPHPRSSDGLLAYVRKRGMEVGAEAAEGFMMVREIRAVAVG